MDVTQVLLVLHFLGMAMGLSASFANFVMMGLIAEAAVPERPVLGRFLPAMSRVGRIGLVLLWLTGLALLFGKWGGFGGVPWQFHVKFTAVLALTIVIGYMHMLERKVKAGDMAAAAKLPALGRIATLFALAIVVLAVLAFN